MSEEVKEMKQDALLPDATQSGLTYLNSVMDFMIESQRQQQTLFNKKLPEHVQRVTIDTDKPIALLLASDIHFGGVYTDYSLLKEMWNWIIETDRLHLAIVGDWIDNFDIPVPKLLGVGINSQIVSPDIQRAVYKQYLKVLQERNKIKAMVLGNHEEFGALDTYFDGTLKFPIAPNRMYLYLTVGRQEYRIALIHKSRFNSIINPIHSCLRELHLNYPDADMVVTSHTHMPAYMTMPYPKDGMLLERLLIKTGSLKNDPYTYKFFNPYGINTEQAIQCVVLHPHKRLMMQMPFYSALEMVL